jgi:hypothetical protein
VAARTLLRRTSRLEGKAIDMKSIVRTFACAAGVIGFLLALGCAGSHKDPEPIDRDGPVEDAGEAVDEAAEDAADATEDAADDAGDAIDGDDAPPEEQ